MKTTRSKLDSLVQAHLGLADAIARSFAYRYASLLERDDLIQVARLELVQAAGGGGWIGTVHEGSARVLCTPFGSE